MNSSLQQEIFEWHRRNYPTETTVLAFIALQEEVGELNRAELKQAEGIRGTWDEWQKEKYKEAGDVIIGLMNFCAFASIDIEEAIESATPFSPVLSSQASIMLLNVGMGKLAEHFMLNSLKMTVLAGYVYRCIEDYCHCVGFKPEQVLADRWATISQRDFIANPLTGGRENEEV